MGSRFTSPNKAQPIWLSVLRAERPACMDVQQWNTYLEGVRTDAMARPELRRRLERGGSVDYCQGCSSERSAQMREQGRCTPAKAKEASDAS